MQPILSLLPSIAKLRVDSNKFRHRGKHNNKKNVHEYQEKWIWIHSPEFQSNFYLYARKTFQLTSKPVTAKLKACADSRYKLYVNGQYVGKGPARSGNAQSYFDTYDISEYLNKGKNVIAFHVHYFGESNYSYISSLPGLLSTCDIQLTKKSLSIATDESWKVKQAEEWTNLGERICDELGFQEVYDSAKAVENWNDAKFNDRRWENAVIVGSPQSMPWGELIERNIPQLNEEEILPAEIIGTFNSTELDRITSPAQIPDIMAKSELNPLRAGKIINPESLLSEDGITFIKTPRGNRGVCMILDFGMEVFGNVEIGISESGTGCVDIGYSETLENGHVAPNRGELKYTDRLILKKGTVDWQSFEPRAFRYMQIEFRWCSRQVGINYIKINQTTYPVRKTGYFECSDELLNNIWQAGAYTAQLCMEDTFISCPWRERAQWWADSRVISRVAYYAFDDVKLLEQGLRQIASTQKEDGSIVGIYPVGKQKMLTDYALLWVFSILDYYAFADDAGLLRSLYPNIKMLIKWFAQFSGDDMLLCNVDGEPFIDWAEIDKRGAVTALNCLYHQALRVTGVIASILGFDDEAQEFINAANRLKVSINKFLFSQRFGLYGDCQVDGHLIEKFSRQTNILALMCDVADQYQKATIFRNLLSDSNLKEIETPYFDSFLLDSLYASDRYDEALQIIRKRWGQMIDADTSTLWEFYHKYGTLCHGWSTGPTRDLIAEYVGIKPVLGSHRFTVAPHTADLKWAKGSVNTKVGPLNIEWKVFRTNLTIAASVPNGLKIDVVLPCDNNSSVTIDGRPYSSKVITLSSGKHRIKVTTQKTKKVEVEYTPLPFNQVELLDETSARGRRQKSLASSNRRTRSKARSKKTEKAEQPENIVSTEITETEEAIVETTVDTNPSKRKKKTRRGGRRRSGKPTAAENTARTEASENIQIIEPAINEQQAAETASAPMEAETQQKEKKPRRRSRRRGRKNAAPNDVSEGQIKIVEEAKPEISKTNETLDLITEKNKQTEEISDKAESNEIKSKKRTHRGGRRRSKKTNVQNVENSDTVLLSDQTQVQESLPSIINTIEPANMQSEDKKTDAVKKTRHRSHRGGRHRKPASDSFESVNKSEAIQNVPQADTASTHAETAQNEAKADNQAEVQKKHTPRRRHRHSKKPEIQPTAADSNTKSTDNIE